MSVHQGFWPDLCARCFDPAIEFTFNAILPRNRQRSALTDTFLDHLKQRIAALVAGDDPRAAPSLRIRPA
jgi:hypothetical protein